MTNPAHTRCVSSSHSMIAVNVCLSVSQVLQLQALQSFQNKAVPAAALLFVHVERAHSLPVSPLTKPDSL